MADMSLYTETALCSNIPQAVARLHLAGPYGPYGLSFDLYRMPNFWHRLWQRWLLGFTWEKLK